MHARVHRLALRLAPWRAPSAALSLALIVAPLVGCRPAPPPPVNEVVALGADSLSLDPGDATWQ